MPVQQLQGTTAIEYNGYVYVMGGYNNSVGNYSTVYSAPLNSNGSVGTWNTTTALPQNIYFATSVEYNGYVYVMGGDDGSSVLTTVYYAPLNTNGTLGSWSSTTSLPQALYRAT